MVKFWKEKQGRNEKGRRAYSKAERKKKGLVERMARKKRAVRVEAEPMEKRSREAFQKRVDEVYLDMRQETGAFMKDGITKYSNKTSLLL